MAKIISKIKIFFSQIFSFYSKNNSNSKKSNLVCTNCGKEDYNALVDIIGQANSAIITSSEDTQHKWGSCKVCESALKPKDFDIPFNDLE